MSDGGYGGSCGGNEGYGEGGYGYGCGQGFDENGCALPSFVQKVISDAGTGNADVGSGVSENACMEKADQCDTQNVGANLCNVGSGVSYSTKNASNAADDASTVSTAKDVDVLGGGAADTITAAAGATGHDTLVVGNGAADGITVKTDDSNDTIVFGNGNGDKAAIADGTNNLVEGGNGAGDLITLGYTTFVAPPPSAGSSGNVTDGTAAQNSNNLLELGNGAGDTIAVGYGNNNTMIVGTGAVINSTEGATTITQTGGDNVSVYSGNNNLLESNDVSSDALGATLYVGSGNNNVLNAGSASNDMVAVGTGNCNILQTSDTIFTQPVAGQVTGTNPAGLYGDQLSVNSGNYNTLISGDGSYDDLSVQTGSYNILCAGDGTGDSVFVGSGSVASADTYTLGSNTFVVGCGNNDIAGFNSGDSNSIYMGGGSGDSATWGTGSDTLVSMGGGNNDFAAYSTGFSNSITLGNGNDDTINFLSSNGYGSGGTGSNNSLVVGNGCNDFVTADGDNNLLQCGNGNGDVLALGFAFNLQTFGAYSPSDTTLVASLQGVNNVMEAGNGVGDVLLGDGSNVLVAGGGQGNASFNGTSWSGTWGDTLTGGASTAADGSTGVNALDPFNMYVLNCQGGDLVQDTSEDLNTTLSGGTSGSITSGAMVFDFGSDTQSQNYCGNPCQTSASNAIDVTDLGYASGSMTASETGTDVNGGELWTFSNGSGGSVSIDLFGQFTAAGFSFSSDTGMTNQAASYEGAGVGGGSALATDAGGTVITYNAPQGGNYCGGENYGGCGNNNNNNNCGGGQQQSGCGGGGQQSGCGESGGGSCGIQVPCGQEGQYFTVGGCG